MARKPDEIQNPNGFPFRLYILQAPKAKKKMVVASSREVAVQSVGLKPKDKKKAVPVSYFDLLAANGHQKTNEILKSIGPAWILKEGKVFFKTLNQ